MACWAKTSAAIHPKLARANGNVTVLRA